MAKAYKTLILLALTSLVLVFSNIILAKEVAITPVVPVEGIPKTTNYKSGTYKANPHNFSAVQDQKGIMYFGNLWGLLAFDGSEWRRIFLPNGVSCTSFAKDDQGTIYVGGRNEIGYLKESDTSGKTYCSLRSKVPAEFGSFNEVWRTFSNSDGVYFFSFEALFFMPKGTNTIKLIGKSFQNAFIIDQKIYVLDNRGLSMLRNGSFATVIKPEFIKGRFITDIVSSEGLFLLSFNEDGLFAYDGISLKPWNNETNSQFKNASFDKIYKTKDNLIFTTLLNGIVISDFKGNVLYHLNKSNGLISNTISGCYLDRDGNLWITTDTGISYSPLNNQLFLINDYVGVSGTPYSSAIFNNNLYLSTSEGVFKKEILNQNSWKKEFFGKVNGISGLVWQLFVYDNKLFCGHATGAYIMEHGQVKKIFDEGTWLFLPLDDPNLMLIGTYNGLAILSKNNGKWSFRNYIKGFKESSRFLVQDKYGDFWVSHGNKGVYQIRLNNKRDSVLRVVHYGKENGLPENFDNTIFKINHEIIISAVKGVYKYDDDRGKITPYKTLTDVIGSNAHIERIVEYSPNIYWLIFNRGNIAKVEFDTKNGFKIAWETKKLKYKLIEAFEHLNPMDEKNFIIGTQDGFGILKGIDTYKQDKIPFDCYITRSETGNDLLYFGYRKGSTKIRNYLPYQKRSIKFTFTATSFDDIENIQYQYYLEGFDEDKKWSDWTNIPFKEYTNLKEGDYVFYVRAQNSGSKVSNESVLGFSIRPPWYRTWYAYFVYFILIIFGIYSISYKIKKTYEKERKKIELEKQQKLWEQQKEWEDANLKNEKQLMMLQQQKLNAEEVALRQKEYFLKQEEEKERMILEMEREKLDAIMGSKNNELRSLTIQISQKNELLNKIKGSINKSVKESSDPDTKKILMNAQLLLEKGLNSGKEWEMFQMHFNNVHEGFFKKLQIDFPDLKPSTLKLCAYLKMRLSSKQIAVLTSTSPDSIIKARYRLRRKFNLNKEMGLEEFLNGY